MQLSERESAQCHYLITTLRTSTKSLCRCEHRLWFLRRSNLKRGGEIALDKEQERLRNDIPLLRKVTK